jgi:hypothetical protein
VSISVPPGTTDIRGYSAYIMATVGFVLWILQTYAFHGNLPPALSGFISTVTPAALGFLLAHIALYKPAPRPSSNGMAVGFSQPSQKKLVAQAKEFTSPSFPPAPKLPRPRSRPKPDVLVVYHSSPGCPGHADAFTPCNRNQSEQGNPGAEASGEH